MTESRSTLSFDTTAELFQQRLSRIQPAQQSLCIFTPKHSAMLHSRSRKSLDSREVGSNVLQSLKNKLNGLEEHGHGRKDFSLGGIGEDTFVDAIFAQVGIEVYFGFMDEFEVGLDDDA